MMETPILEIMKNLKSLNPENFLNLFLEPKFIINKKQLLILYLEQMTLEKGIFEDSPNSKFIFTKETLEVATEMTFLPKTFQRKNF